MGDAQSPTTNTPAHLHPSTRNDWHASRNEMEPRCGAEQWRQRDRECVLYMSEMDERHLRHCIRYASTKPQHRSRLTGLLAEASARAFASAAALNRRTPPANPTQED